MPKTNKSVFLFYLKVLHAGYMGRICGLVCECGQQGCCCSSSSSSSSLILKPFIWCFLLPHLKMQALTASFTFSLSASIALCLLFFPKIFIILLRPEKNVRSSYTTTKLIRCHFGNAAQASAFSDSKQHISGTFSKTRNSSQSLSIGAGSCPTRTASLHVVNHSSATNQSNSTSNQSHQTIGNNSPRRDIQTQTEVGCKPKMRKNYFDTFINWHVFRSPLSRSATAAWPLVLRVHSR